jgi:hypothetical protein
LRIYPLVIEQVYNGHAMAFFIAILNEDMVGFADGFPVWKYLE